MNEEDLKKFIEKKKQEESLSTCPLAKEIEAEKNRKINEIIKAYNEGRSVEQPFKLNCPYCGKPQLVWDSDIKPGKKEKKRNGRL